MQPHTLEEIKTRIAGEVIAPSSPSYDERRRVFNRTGSPAVIVRAQGSEDIAAAIRFAREHHLALSVRSGGHGLSGQATNDGGLVIDLTLLNTVQVLDQERHLVRIGAGARWGDAAKALAPHGLAGRVRTIALPDQFLPQGKASDILKEHGLDAAGIAKSVYQAVRGRVPETTESS